MKSTKFFWSVKMKWVMVFLMLSACVERIEFDVPLAQFQTVVEGMISDSPGPYTVMVSRGLSLNADSMVRTPIQNATIKLYDNQGNQEDFIETSPGVYQTGGLIQGQVGKAYHITVLTSDGKTFESEPETILPVGEVKEIRYAYEARTIFEPFGQVTADVFNIYVDADAGSGNETYVRWKFTGTYEVITHPELHYTWNPPYIPYKNPFPCSGYILTGGPIGSGGLLKQVGDCDCCTCWANQFESEPQISDNQLIKANQFKNIKVGEVPINGATFHKKYMVEVEQLSLSQNAFNFFKLIRDQKKNASSLFQPPSGEINGNLKALNSKDIVIGMFWATSSRKKNIFIYPSDIPYPVTPIDYSTLPCYDAYEHASATKPTSWE